jgi:hypothetical protein
MVHGTGKFTDSEMFRESARLHTFDRWPGQFISVYELAAEGFYYLNKDDLVRFAFSGLQLWDWEHGDNLRYYHNSLSQYCRFVRGDRTRIVPRGYEDDDR